MNYEDIIAVLEWEDKCNKEKTMKLIIDIDEKDYEYIKNSDDMNFNAIKNGIPLKSDETSDLKIKISKLEHDNEVLKNIVKNLIKTLASKGLITNMDSIFKTLKEISEAKGE